MYRSSVNYRTTSSGLTYVVFESQMDERSSKKKFKEIISKFYTKHIITNYCIQVIKY